MKEDKSLLVLGGSSDMGTALIRRVAENYQHIFVHYCHGEAAVQTLRDELGDKVIPFRADLSVQDEVAALIAQIKESGLLPDHIVHFPAPRVTNAKFQKHTWDEYAAGIEVSVHSLVSVLGEFLPLLAKQHYGKVLVVLSSVVCDLPPKYQAPYVSVKYMLLGLMRSLAVEYADKGITVNGVSPDMVETKFLSDIPELIIAQNAAANPLGRNLCIEEVIPAMEYLLSDGADGVTGQNILIAGGKV